MTLDHGIGVRIPAPQQKRPSYFTMAFSIGTNGLLKIDVVDIANPSAGLDIAEKPAVQPKEFPLL